MPLPRWRLPPLCGKLENRYRRTFDGSGRSSPSVSVCSSDVAFTQYSFDEFASRICGHVPLSRQRRRRPSVLSVTGSCVTL